METQDKQKIAAMLAEADARLKAVEKDISDMERAGLGEQARALKEKLAISRDKMLKMKAVYGTP